MNEPSASGPLRVAFVCVRNAGRSQMAHAFAEREREARDAGDLVGFVTGGTDPAEHVHPVVVEAMAEVGIDLSGRTPHEITPEDVEACDVLITMGCSAAGICPATWRGDNRDWDLDDPHGEDLDAVREIRDEIEEHVLALFDELEPVSEDGAESSDSGLEPAEQRRAVRERYGAIATESAGATETDDSDTPASTGCCGTDGDVIDEPASSGCCRTDDGGDDSDEVYAAKLGYSDDDVDAVAEGANLGLGCGNPTAIAGLEPGETVLDLGSGGGFDCFLAAREVGEGGNVVGVDMTPEMVEKARENAERNDAENVEFRLGEIEHLPVADGSVDVVISNCVINLSPDKPQVFREAHRVLRSGGRLSISDVVLSAPVPAELRGDPTSVASCVAGAAPVDEVESMLVAAGFEDVTVELESGSEAIVSEWDDECDLSEFVVSAQITGWKPRGEPSTTNRTHGDR